MTELATAVLICAGCVATVLTVAAWVRRPRHLARPDRAWLWPVLIACAIAWPCWTLGASVALVEVDRRGPVPLLFAVTARPALWAVGCALAAAWVLGMAWCVQRREVRACR